MTESSIDIFAEIREKTGRSSNNILRKKNNLIPAIIYGAGEKEILVSVGNNDIVKASRDRSFFSKILHVKIKNQNSIENVVLKTLQRHPVKSNILHIDFQRIKSDEKIYMYVPLKFIGRDICPGVKLQGGQFISNMTDIEIRCYPNDLPKFIEVNVSNLNINDVIHLKDISISKDIEFSTLIQDSENNPAIASIQHMRSSEDKTSGVEEENVETEIIREKKEKVN